MSLKHIEMIVLVKINHAGPQAEYIKSTNMYETCLPTHVTATKGKKQGHTRANDSSVN